jgi:hypothetical protein
MPCVDRRCMARSGDCSDSGRRGSRRGADRDRRLARGPERCLRPSPARASSALASLALLARCGDRPRGLAGNARGTRNTGAGDANSTEKNLKLTAASYGEVLRKGRGRSSRAKKSGNLIPHRNLKRSATEKRPAIYLTFSAGLDLHAQIKSSRRRAILAFSFGSTMFFFLH